MAERQTYTVLVPFPIGRGHWSNVGQELSLLDVEASALRSAGRLQLKKSEGVESSSHFIPAKKAVAKKAE
jgi:hypothetical protein